MEALTQSDVGSLQQLILQQLQLPLEPGPPDLRHQEGQQLVLTQAGQLRHHVVLLLGLLRSLLELHKESILDMSTCVPFKTGIVPPKYTRPHTRTHT